MVESPVYSLTTMSAAAGAVLLTAIPGKSYRILSCTISAANTAADAGERIEVYHTTPRDGSVKAIARAFIVPNVVNVENLDVGMINIITKPGTPVTVDYGGMALNNFHMVNISLRYTEIDG